MSLATKEALDKESNFKIVERVLEKHDVRIVSETDEVVIKGSTDGTVFLHLNDLRFCDWRAISVELDKYGLALSEFPRAGINEFAIEVLTKGAQ